MATPSWRLPVRGRILLPGEIRKFILSFLSPYIFSLPPLCDRMMRIRFWRIRSEFLKSVFEITQRSYLLICWLIIFTRNGQPGLGGESNVSGWDLARDLAARNVSVVTPDIGRLSSGYKKKKKITKPYGKSCKCREKSNAEPSKATVLLVPRERKKMICKSKKRKK